MKPENCSLKKRFFVSFLFLSFCLLLPVFFIGGCSSSKITEVFIEKSGNYDSLSFSSPAVSDNRMEKVFGQAEMTMQTIEVILPPEYSEENDPYPVIYFLNGYDSPTGTLRSFTGEIHKKMSQGDAAPAVIVLISGTNSLDGSFYLNSKITGRWEDYITQEVISVIEDNYNVSREKTGRGIAGFSMGGFGALNIGLRHPDLYCGIFAFAPGVFTREDFPSVLEDWETERSSHGTGKILSAYAASVTETLDIPQLNGTEKDNKIVEKWLTGMSNWEEKIGSYKKKKETLEMIALCCAAKDGYRWIENGVNDIDRILLEEEIPHQLFRVAGGHQLTKEVTADLMIPFFSELWIKE